MTLLPKGNISVEQTEVKGTKVNHGHSHNYNKQSIFPYAHKNKLTM